MSFEGFPFIVGWELTLACNLRCAHCGSSAGLPRQDELTTEEALKICDQLPALLVQEVDFTGGEPLLRPDWAVIASHLIELGIPVNSLTNGLEVGADTVAQMKDIGISCVGISLDGLERTHDTIRSRQGAFAAVTQSIALMQRADIPINVITTVNAINLPELPEILPLLQSMGVEQWRLQPIIPMGRVNSHPELAIDDDGILGLGRFIKEQKSNAGDGAVNIICGDGLEYIVEGETNERPWRGCSAGIVACGITSDGKVKGCLSMPDELVEGDLRKNDLWDIWFHADAFAYNRHFKLDKMGPNCKACDKAEECMGGCSSNSYCATGKFHNDPYCFYKLNKVETARPA